MQGAFNPAIFHPPRRERCVLVSAGVIEGVNGALLGEEDGDRGAHRGYT